MPFAAANSLRAVIRRANTRSRRARGFGAVL